MIYFTGDQHFGHRNIIRYTNRPFNTVEEMDEGLISRWNEVVRANDTVYILGDISLYGVNKTAEILGRLKGRKAVLIGNHDGVLCTSVFYKELFFLMDKLYTLKVHNRRYILCHYPLYSWEGAYSGACLLYGHTHKSSISTLSRRAYNVGVDLNDYYPISLEDINAWIDALGDDYMERDEDLVACSQF